MHGLCSTKQFPAEENNKIYFYKSNMFNLKKNILYAITVYGYRMRQKCIFNFDLLGTNLLNIALIKSAVVLLQHSYS